MMPFSDIDQLDEYISAHFPQEISLRDGTELTLAPMVPSVWPMMEEFVGATPDEERKFFRHEASDPALVQRWCSELDYRHTLPLLAWHSDEVAADATLQREAGIWTAHVGRMRLLVRPEFRRRGLGERMLHETIKLAAELGLHKLVHECAAEQENLIGLLSALGFHEAARLPDFIRDQHGAYHDMVLMIRELENA